MKPLQPITVPPGGGQTHNVLGAPYRFLATGAETGGAFALLEVTAPPQSGVPLLRNPENSASKYLVLITPAGLEKCLVEFAQLPADRPPAPETLVEIGKRYGLE